MGVRRDKTECRRDGPYRKSAFGFPLTTGNDQWSTRLNTYSALPLTFFCILIQDYSYPFDHPNNNKQTRLLFVVFDAIAEGNTEVLRDKLQPFSGDINAIRYEDTSPLMWAVLHRRPEVVEMVRISLTWFSHTSQLNKDETLVKVALNVFFQILASGASVNHGDNWETLHTAVCDRNIDMIKLLLAVRAHYPHRRKLPQGYQECGRFT